MKLRICPDCMDNLVSEPGQVRCRDCTPGAATNRQHAADLNSSSRKPPPRERESCAGDISSAREPEVVIDLDRLAAHYPSG
jgi:hypothetical protein